MIRTQSKEKLPKGFSYPVGASALSLVIGDIPQEDMELLFVWRDEFWKSKWQKRIDTLGVVTLIEARYWNTYDDWRLFAYAVPREYSAVARKFLLSGPLSALGAILRQVGREPRDFASHMIQFELSKKAPANNAINSDA